MILLRLALPLLLPLTIVACDGRPLPVATGPVRQLNVGRWTPGPNDLTTPPAASNTSAPAATVARTGA